MTSQLRNLDLRTAKIAAHLPDYFGRRHDRFPEDMIGATIVAIGTLEQPDAVEGGGTAYAPITAVANTWRR